MFKISRLLKTFLLGLTLSSSFPQLALALDTSPPTGLTASTDPVTGHLILTWNADTRSHKDYWVYQDKNCHPVYDFRYYSAIDVTTNNRSDVSLTLAPAGSHYCYAIAEELGTNSSGYYMSSASAVIVGTPIALGATGITVTSTLVGKINVAWSTVSGASNYKVYRSATSTGTYSLISSPTSAVYSDVAVTPGVTYWYKISAVVNSTEGSQSAGYSGMAVVGTPTGLTASSTQPGSVDLTWVSTSGATSYKIYRSASSNGTYTAIGSPPSTSYSDASVVPGTTYWYKVSAVANSAEGGQSSSVSGMAVSSIPTGLTATQGTVTGMVQLTWAVVNGSSNYGVYRDGVQLGFVNNAYYDDVISDASVHSYTITAVVNSIESGQSAAVTGYANQAPTSASASASVAAGMSVVLTPVVVDPNPGDTFTFSVISQPLTGVASIQNGELVYQSQAQYAGDDGFDFMVSDRAGATVTGFATIAITGDQAPTVTGNQAISGGYRFIVKTPM